MKVTADNSTSGKTITTTTRYLNGFIYESKTTAPADANNPDYADKLQFLGHEEGRIRALYDNASTPTVITGYAYDYFLKDHLGNVRMVLTDEVKQDKYPVASLEPSKIATEKLYYDIKDAQVVDKATATGITNYINDNGIGNNPTDAAFSATYSTKLYQLNSNTAKTGLGITLKVMAGDKIDVFGKSYYFTNNPGSSYNNNLPIIDLLTAFLAAPAAAATTAMHGAVTPALINTTTNTAGITSMMTQQSTQNGGAPLKPKAFINVIFFDEQFKVADYRVSIVGSNNVVKDHYADLQNITVPKNGYVYIYCSNESPVNVFFDNIQVVQTRGPILEETHYYPFGLTMAGISSKAAGASEGKKKFQGQEFAHKEFSDRSGLEMYEFKWRMDDPQTGRFWQVDPLADKYVYNSPYAFSENKVTSHVELEGLEAADFNIERDLRDVQSGEVTPPQLKARQEVRGKAQAVGTAVGVGIGLSFMFPEAAQVVFATEIFGVPSPTAPTSVVGTIASETKTLTTLEQNVATGKDFEQKVVASLTKNGNTNVAEQVTIKAGNGVNTRLDAVSRDANGKIVLTEAKGSATAPLTKNQKIAHPSIEQSGGVVTGQGKPGFPGGTVIPPTKVDVVRPKKFWEY